MKPDHRQIGIPSIEVTTNNHITLRLDFSWAATRYGLKRSLAKERKFAERLSEADYKWYGDKRKIRTYELATLPDNKGVEIFLAFLKSQEIPYRIT